MLIELSTRNRSVRGAFTLIELLVVIGVISLLIAILLPVLTNLRRAAQSVVCLNNLREIGHASVSYANDNNSWLLPLYHSTVYPQHRVGGNGELRDLLLWADVPLEFALCPTAPEPEEFISYPINTNAQVGLKRLGGGSLRRERDLPPSDFPFFLENSVASNEEEAGYWYNTPEDLQRQVDLQRHGPGHGSSYLWLDFHASQEQLTYKELAFRSGWGFGGGSRETIELFAILQGFSENKNGGSDVD